jgi:hypothetical protein
MAGSKPGNSTIIKAAAKISKMVSVYGATNLEFVTTPGFNIAVQNLVVEYQLFKASDDFAGQIDSSGPIRPNEDVPPGPP